MVGAEENSQNSTPMNSNISQQETCELLGKHAGYGNYKKSNEENFEHNSSKTIATSRQLTAIINDLKYTITVHASTTATHTTLAPMVLPDSSPNKVEVARGASLRPHETQKSFNIFKPAA